ncbi:hypothetical protein [Rubripirellula lacrimiformis]|uniref:hypothetical protein n=1 Tax=Rubripirellula lacrimiformis TaxID=1930273 RepID=UPI001C54C63F|nr:hypothetical protein [Rubripirellula lacrimiformis]
MATMLKKFIFFVVKSLANAKNRHSPPSTMAIGARKERQITRKREHKTTAFFKIPCEPIDGVPHHTLRSATVELIDGGATAFFLGFSREFASSAMVR